MSSFAERIKESNHIADAFTSRLRVKDICNAESEKRIQAAVESLLAHNGPTAKGVAVDEYRLCAEELDIALMRAKQQGLDSAWHPVHFAGVWGRNKQAETIESLILGKVRHLRDTRYGGDLFKVITQAKAKEFLTDYEETIAGRTVTVTFNRAASRFHNSPYEIIRAYLALTDIDEKKRYAQMQPWHFRNLPKTYLSDPQNCAQLISLKIDQLLAQPGIDGDFYKFANQVTYKTLTSDLLCMLDGREIRVPLSEVMKTYDSSPFKALCAYLQYKHSQGKLLNIKFLPPYALKKMSDNFYQDQSVLEEVFVLFMKSLIAKHGGVPEAIRELNSSVARAGFELQIGSSLVHVPTKKVVRTLGVSRGRAHQLYDQISPTIDMARWLV